jgi:hypothetical protein
MQITNETKAQLQAEKGRVIGFVKSNEPGKISLAVTGDRAVMTPAQARQLAAWLNEEADKGGRTSPVTGKPADWRTAELKRQEEIRAALSTPYRRAY